MILKNVSFSNVPNKKQGTKIGTMLTQSNIKISDEVSEYLQSEDFYKLICALDIDWAGIEIDENITINDTADLINWIKSIANSGSGETGFKGPQGDQGTKGITGNQGTFGPQGEIGSKGQQGDKGIIGSQGIQGTKGVQGLRGENGYNGIPGTQGVKGEKGIQGEKGQQGDTGIIGSQGIQGPKGIQGVKGQQGAQGVPGIVQGNVVTSNIQWLKINVVDVMPETPDENTLYIVQ